MFDSISLSILWSRLITIVDEAGTTLQRTSFSTVTRESADFAVVLMDTKGHVPIEVLENDCPVLVTQKNLARGSGGKGKFKGGDGQIFSFKNIGQHPLSISIITEKTKTQTYGLFGGESGKRGSAKLSNGRKLPAKGIDKLMPNEELILTLPDGGGYGTPSV